jgi:uncharacterized protein (DUF2236 family)
VPVAGLPLSWFLYLPTVGLLPAPLRDAYGLAWDARRERALMTSAALIRQGAKFTPNVLRYVRQDGVS